MFLSGKHYTKKSKKMKQIHGKSSQKLTTSHLPHWQERLAKRGILQVALRAGWTGAKHEWVYPVRDLYGHQLAQRSKAYDSNAKPKYRWLPAKPKGCDYYYPPFPASETLLNAIAQDDGCIYIAAGEIDVLTYAQANIVNVLAWFGETSVPRHFNAHLQNLGVRHVVYLPDKDDAGLKSAIKVRDALLNSDITFEARSLPDSLPAKADTNDLWCELDFDTSAFRQYIINAPTLKLPEPRTTNLLDAFKPQYQPRVDDGDLAQLAKNIERALGIHHYNGDGWSHAIPCLFKRHEHDDVRPASSWHQDMHIFHCHKCGETWLAKDVAVQLGMDWQRQRPERDGVSLTDLAQVPDGDNKPSLQDRVRDVYAEPFTADMTVNMPYVSELDLNALPNHSLLVRSAIGTGKTELVHRLIQHKAQELGYQPTVLVVTHRQALAQNIAERLGMECYKDLDSAWYRSAPQLVIVYNSLWKLGAMNEPIPQYDLLVIDEIEQFHNHLGGNTFTGGEAKRAYDMLRQLVVSAGRVVGLDAHASDISGAWLHTLLPLVTTIDNTYTPNKGTMTLHANSETIVERALQIADADEGTVVIPTSSKAEAQRLEYLFKERYGEEHVYMICAENSESAEAQAFIRDINTRLPKLKLFIYSPSLGTGIDIKVPVRAVCAVFKGHHLPAGDLHQLLGRCRSTQETHAYVQPVKGRRLDDWQMIYNMHERNAIRTGEICDFNQEGIYAITPIQQSMLKLLSLLEASRNRSINDLLSYFVSLSQGYHVCYHDGENHALREELRESKQILAKIERHNVMQAEPIDHAQMDLHRQEGTLTPEIRAGHRRWLIEDSVGCTLDDQLYDDLHAPKAREHLRHFTDLATDELELRQRDQQQASDDHLLHQRNHHTMRQRLLKRLIRDVWGEEGLEAGTELGLSKADITARMTDFMQLHLVDLVTFFKWRADQSQQSVAILRWMLSQIGLKLESEQVMRDGQRFRVYRINSDDYEKQRHYARLRREHLLEQARLRLEEAEALGITQNVMEYNNAPLGQSSITTTTGGASNALDVPF
jgi:hypothetical protein